MTEFLVKKFVKNYNQHQEPQVRTAYGVLSSFVGIICNIVLFGGKLVIGLLMNSIAVMADAFNNLSDAASSIISLIGVKMASKPADEDHPFGHGRMEYIAALIVSFLVIEFGITFFKSSFNKIFHPQDMSFELLPFIFLVLSVGVKFWMSKFNKKLGNRINSKVMLATSADSMGDVFTTGATIFSIMFSKISGINIDAYAGLVVSILVVWSGIGIAKDTLAPLIGQAIDPQLCADIKNIVESYDGIVGTHDLLVHNYGPNQSMASIHAEVPCDVSIETSHEIIDRIEAEVSKKLGIVLVIHMDPVELKDEKVLDAREKLECIIQTLDEDLSFHDFRLVNGERQINLIFDLVVPYSYADEQKIKVLQQIRALMSQLDKRYHCVIMVDRDYVGKNA